MRFATLFGALSLREQVDAALCSIGIEVRHFSAVDALIAGLQSEPFEAILLEDSESHIGHWLGALQQHAAEPVALIVVGAGGAAGMSRALLRGADDYIVIGDGAEQLVHRTIARASSKIRRPQAKLQRLGPYRLDSSLGTLASAAAEVRLSPRELLLAKLLFDNPGRVIALDRLGADLCGRSDAAARRAVKQHAHTLRKKCALVAASASQVLDLESAYGAGYRLTLRTGEAPTRRST